MEENTQKNTQKKESPFAFIRSVLLTVFVTWFVLNFIIINANIPSGSMENTIMTGDRVIGIRLIKDYNRGDIVIFPDPEQEGRYLIKRVIGLPGETVQIIGGLVYIDGAPLEDESGLGQVSLAGRAGSPITLGEDEYFLLGDNRDSSEDSRFANVGNVKADQIQGKVWLRILPILKLGFL